MQGLCQQVYSLQQAVIVLMIIFCHAQFSDVSVRTYRRQAACELCRQVILRFPALYSGDVGYLPKTEICLR
jgi:hypothetical protein